MKQTGIWGLRLGFLAVALLVTAGWLALTAIRTISRPSPRPVAEVTVWYPGAGARQIEGEIVAPLERAIGRSPEVVTIESSAREGEARLLVSLRSDSETGPDRMLEQAGKGLPDRVTEFVISTLQGTHEPAGRILTAGAAVALLMLIFALGSARPVLAAAAVLPVTILAVAMVGRGAGLLAHPLALVALVAGLGVVLDDLITVGENILRHRELGSDPRRAIRIGVAELRSGLITGSLAVLALWVVPALGSGEALEWIRPPAGLSGWAVLFSAGTALVLLPRAALWSAKLPSGTTLSRLVGPLSERFDRVADWYHEQLAWVLDHRRLSGAVAVGLLMLGAVAAGRIRMPSGDARLVVQVQGPDASTLTGVAHRIGDELRAVPGVSGVSIGDSGGAITHHNGVRVIAVEARLDERLGTVEGDVEHRLSQVPIPPGYRILRQPAGTESDRVVRRWIGGLVMALAIVWLILARHLRSWLEPVVLMPALALPGLGAMAAAALSGGGMSLPGLVAVTMVAGLVLRQSTVLLTCAGRRRARGANLRVAVIEAARLRLRPVLLTLVALTGAALPLFWSGVQGGAAFGWATLGGMLLAAPATLLLTPVLYEMVVELGARFD